MLQASAGQARDLKDLYRIVLELRPSTAKETVRARVYEAVQDGRLLRVSRGVYIARDGPASLVLVEGDAWAALRELPAKTVDLLVTDQPWDMGTDWYTRCGSTRLGDGRGYSVRDVDREFLKEAHRVLRSDHEWRHQRDANKTMKGGGALILFSPNLTGETWPHIKALLDLAIQLGFEYQGAFVWHMMRRGMGWKTGANEYNLLHFFVKGKRKGVGWTPGLSNVLRHKGIRSHEHAAQKPPGLFMDVIRFCCRPGDVVLDTFAGRAAWAKQAVKEGYNVVLVEKEPRHVEQITTDWK